MDGHRDVLGWPRCVAHNGSSVLVLPVAEEAPTAEEEVPAAEEAAGTEETATEEEDSCDSFGVGRRSCLPPTCGSFLIW